MDRIKLTGRGIDVVERHLARFGPDPANLAMTAALEDYGLREGPAVLYHPSVGT